MSYHITVLAHTRFDVVTVCPPYVLGPIIHEAASPKTLNTCLPMPSTFTDQDQLLATGTST